MRRPLFPVLVLVMGLTAAGCSDEPPAPLGPAAPPGSLLLTSTPTVQDLRVQIDALLLEPARTAAQFALSRVDADIRLKRSTLYASSLVLAAIPLVERRFDRIPEEKIANLLKLLCGVAELIRPHLPSTFPRIDFCQVDPAHLTDDAAFRLVTNATGATITTGTQKFSLDIEAGSMSVNAVLITVLPLLRTSAASEVGISQVTDLFPCPTPWDPAFAAHDCLPEFYEVAVLPAVTFNPAADLQICQIDPSATVPQTPSSAVLSRLRLFSKDGNNQVSILGQDAESPASAEANCAEIEHAVIGSAGFSRSGMRNAFRKLARFASDALSVFRPTPLYALNFPTHGDVLDEWGEAVGFVVGAIDPVVRVVEVQVSPESPSILVGGTVQMSVKLLNKVGGEITAPTSLQGTTWSTSNAAVADVDANGLVTGKAAGTAVIKATVGTGTGASTVSDETTVTVLSPAVSLVFIVQPSATVSGTAISPAVVVRAQDNLGAVLASVNVTIADGPGNAALGCGMVGAPQQAITNAVGEATFAGIAVGGACSGATLAATGALLGFATGTTISAPFTIIGFARAAFLGTARGNPEATTLGNGKVLVTGGVNALGPVAGGELWDPALSSFSSAGTMGAARNGHGATLLSSGLVLITGGFGTSGALQTAELWTVTVPSFSPTQSMGAARAFHTATVLPSNSFVLVAGGLGEGGVLASAELYDPVAGGFASTGGMTNARARHTATVLPNGTVLIAAGGSNGEVPLATAEIYDPSAGSFSPTTGTLNDARTRHTATRLPSGQVLIVGGKGSIGVLATAELYNPATQTFTLTGSMSTPRQFHTATLLPNGTVLVAGGENASGSLATAEIYDPATSTFTLTGSMGTARHDHAAAIQPDSKALIIGGIDAANIPLASVERYVAKP